MPGTVRNMVTIGGPHMGVDKVPHCFSGEICDIVNDVVEKAVYYSLAQDWIAPAGYFRDTTNFAAYQKGSVFLPKLNNESVGEAAATKLLRKTRFSALNAGLLVMFANDTMIHPKETAHFQSPSADGKTVLPLNGTDFYNQDFIGVKALNEAGKLTFDTWPGDHLQFTETQIKNVVIPFLNK